MDNSNQESPAIDREILRKTAKCLSEYLKVHRRSGRLFDVLDFLASQTLLHLSDGKSPHFNNLAIKDAILGNMSNDASAWLSPLWKKLNNELLPSLEEGLQKYAHDQGLEYFPWVGRLDSSGGAGNQALYFIQPRKINNLAEETTKPDLLADVTYIPAANITPSWWARRLFSIEYSVTGWRKNIFILSPLFWVILTTLLSFAIWMMMSRNNSPVTSQEILYLFILIAFGFWTRYEFMRIIRLGNDRIIMAPERYIGYSEYGVCLELVRIQDRDKNKALRLVKYASQCPVCGAEILLDEGEPDFPRRIIGRCQESPREHIYSFDRVTKTGRKLR